MNKPSRRYGMGEDGLSSSDMKKKSNGKERTLVGKLLTRNRKPSRSSRHDSQTGTADDSLSSSFSTERPPMQITCNNEPRPSHRRQRSGVYSVAATICSESSWNSRSTVRSIRSRPVDVDEVDRLVDVDDCGPVDLDDCGPVDLDEEVDGQLAQQTASLTLNSSGPVDVDDYLPPEDDRNCLVYFEEDFDLMDDEFRELMGYEEGFEPEIVTAVPSNPSCRDLFPENPFPDAMVNLREEDIFVCANCQGKDGGCSGGSFCV